MSRSHRTIGLAIGAIATIALVWYAAGALRGQDLSRYASPRSAWAIGIAALCYASIIPVSAWAWRRLLRDLGVDRTWRELVEIMAITQLAKYVPGNIGFHLGRAAMAISKGMKPRPLVASMLMETVLAVAAALTVGLAGAGLSGRGAHLVGAEVRSGLELAAWMLAGLLAAVVLLRVARPLVHRLAQRHLRPLLGGSTVRLSTALQAFVAYAANYVVIGIGIWCLAELLFPRQQHDVGLLCASFALAWVAGFFTPGAPAGLGVREALMLLVLGAAYAKPDALVIVIALRLATVLGDALSFLAGYALLLSSHRRQGAAPDSR